MLCVVVVSVFLPTLSRGQCELFQGGNGRVVSLEATHELLFQGTRLLYDEGAVQVHHYSPVQFLPGALLVPSDSAPGDLFGVALDAHGDLLVVGAPGAAFPQSGAGAAYVYRLQNGQWVEEARLSPNTPTPGAGFGREVAVRGNHVLVGAARDDEGGNDAGAAYVFAYDGSQWTQQEKILALGGQAGDRFGTAVTLLGTRALIGAPRADGTGEESGVAYVFDLAGAAAQQEALLLPPAGTMFAEFGRAVALVENGAVVAAPDLDSVFTYTASGGSWGPGVPLEPSAGTPTFDFGASISADGDELIVSAPDDNSSTAGAVYHFSRQGSEWIQADVIQLKDVAGGVITTGYRVAVAGPFIAFAAFTLEFNLEAAFVYAAVTAADCDANGVVDLCQLQGTSEGDCDHDGRPDSCSLEADCNANLTPDACDTTSSEVLLDESFENGLPAGWSSSGLWQITSQCHGPDVCDGVQWAGFGIESDCTFDDNGAAVSGSLVLPVLALPQNALRIDLTFCSSYGGECGSQIAGYDLAQVRVNGILLDDVGQGCDQPTWETRHVDLQPFAGEDVVITFEFDSLDGQNNTGIGWQVDGINVQAMVPDETLDANLNGVPDGCETRFIRGDCNTDGVLDIADAITMIMRLFRATTTSCNEACDADSSGAADISDVVLVLDGLFGERDLPTLPFPECGLAPTWSDLGCDDFPPCP